MLPAVGVVQVGEEQNSAAEEAEQQGGAVDPMQQPVLLLELMDTPGQVQPPGPDRTLNGSVGSDRVQNMRLPGSELSPDRRTAC